MKEDELIKLGRQIYPIDVKKEEMGYSLGINYRTWLNDCLNYLESKYPGHRMTNEFKDCKEKAINCWTDEFDNLISILESFKNLNKSSYLAKESGDKMNGNNIFISYSSVDKGYGEALVNLLEKLGVDSSNITFTERKKFGINSGEDVLDRLKNDLNKTQIFIPLLSNNYYNSPFCLCELGAAWVTDIKMYPLLMPNIEVKDAFKGTISKFKEAKKIDNNDEIQNFSDMMIKDLNLNIDNFRYINAAIERFLSDVSNVQEDIKDIFITCSSTRYLNMSNVIDIKTSTNAFKKFLDVCAKKEDDKIQKIAILEKGNLDQHTLIIKTYFKVKRKSFSAFEVIGKISTLKNPIIINNPQNTPVMNEKLFSVNDLKNNNIYYNNL